MAKPNFVPPNQWELVDPRPNDLEKKITRGPIEMGPEQIVSKGANVPYPIAFAALIVACILGCLFGLQFSWDEVEAQTSIPGTELRLNGQPIDDLRLKQILQTIERMQMDVSITRSTVQNIERNNARWERIVGPIIDRIRKTNNGEEANSETDLEEENN